VVYNDVQGLDVTKRLQPLCAVVTFMVLCIEEKICFA
jgi:hypothetical protein